MDLSLVGRTAVVSGPKAGIGLAVAEAAFFKTQRPTSLLKRFATMKEAANMAACLCAPASATNGATVRVDGGVAKAII